MGRAADTFAMAASSTPCDPGTPALAIPRSTKPRRRRRAAAVVVAVLTACGAGLVWCGLREPSFYRRAGGSADTAAEQAVRRLFSSLSALQADVEREGSWGAAFDDAGINAWLARDLPRNHPGFLPDGMSSPRLAFTPGRVHAGVRLTRAGLSAVCWAVAEVRLREPNQLGIVLEQAGVGSLPLPRGLIVAELARGMARLGLAATVRRLGDRTVLVVYIPATHESGRASHWLEALTIGAGDMTLAGQTLHAPPRPAAAGATR